MSIEHLPNRDAIEDVLYDGGVSPFGLALQWAHRTDAPELTEFYEAIADNAIAAGNSSAISSKVYRATLILLDAWIESKKKEAA